MGNAQRVQSTAAEKQNIHVLQVGFSFCVNKLAKIRLLAAHNYYAI